MAFRPRTILRLRARTPAMSIAKPSHVMPNSLLRRKYDATFALWIMFLLGKHAMFGHDPPMYLRSTTATRFPSPAKVHAAMVEPVPPPRITRSNSSGCDFLKTWADGELSVLFMRLFLSEQEVRSWLALISRDRPPTLLRARAHTQLLAQCALSRVE